MLRKTAWVAVCLLMGLPATAVGGEKSGASLEQRLAALERRVEQLEEENRGLRRQVAQLLPRQGSPRVEFASTAPLPRTTLAAVTPPASGVHNPRPASALAVVDARPTAAAPAPPPATPAEKLESKSERIEVGGEIRFRAETRQNLDLNSQRSDAGSFVGERLRFHVRAKLNDQVEAFIQFQDSRLWGQETSTASNDNLTDLHQGYLRVKDFLAPGLGLNVGRQELAYGSERLIGAFGWDNVGRSFDAVKMGYSSKTWGSDWFAAKVVDRRQTGRGDRDQYLYGFYNNFLRQRPQHLEVYGFFFRDGLRTVGELPVQGQRATLITTLGFRTDGTLGKSFDYDLEFAKQFGHWGADSHSARALAVKVFQTLEETHRLRLGFEYDVASGDSDPQDGKSGEFFNLFPTNHIHYGYADQMGWRNMQDFRPTFTVVPGRSVRFEFDYHRFYLLEARGPWKNAGGAVLGFDPTGQSGAHVGDELDFTLAFPLHKHLRMLAGYSLFLPGEFARNTRGQDKQHFFYLQTLVDF